MNDVLPITSAIHSQTLQQYLEQISVAELVEMGASGMEKFRGEERIWDIVEQGRLSLSRMLTIPVAKDIHNWTKERCKRPENISPTIQTLFSTPLPYSHISASSQYLIHTIFNEYIVDPQIRNILQEHETILFHLFAELAFASTTGGAWAYTQKESTAVLNLYLGNDVFIKTRFTQDLVQLVGKNNGKVLYPPQIYAIIKKIQELTPNATSIEHSLEIFYSKNTSTGINDLVNSLNHRFDGLNRPFENIKLSQEIKTEYGDNEHIIVDLAPRSSPTLDMDRKILNATASLSFHQETLEELNENAYILEDELDPNSKRCTNIPNIESTNTHVKVDPFNDFETVKRRILDSDKPISFINMKRWLFLYYEGEESQKWLDKFIQEVAVPKAKKQGSSLWISCSKGISDMIATEITIKINTDGTSEYTSGKWNLETGRESTIINEYDPNVFTQFLEGISADNVKKYIEYKIKRWNIYSNSILTTEGKQSFRGNIYARDIYFESTKRKIREFDTELEKLDIPSNVESILRNFVTLLLGYTSATHSFQNPESIEEGLKPLLEKYLYHAQDVFVDKYSPNLSGGFNVGEHFNSVSRFSIHSFLQKNLESSIILQPFLLPNSGYTTQIPPSQGMEYANRAVNNPNDSFTEKVIGRVHRPSDNPEKENDGRHLTGFTMFGLHKYETWTQEEIDNNYELSYEKTKQAYGDHFDNLKAILKDKNIDFEGFKKNMIFTLNEGGEYILHEDDYPDHIPFHQRHVFNKKFTFPKDEMSKEILMEEFGIEEHQIKYGRPKAKETLSDPWGEPFMGRQCEITYKMSDGKEMEIGFISFLDHIRMKEVEGKLVPFMLTGEDENHVQQLHSEEVQYVKNKDGCMISAIWGVERVILAGKNETIQDYYKDLYGIFSHQLTIYKESLEDIDNANFSDHAKSIIYSIIDLWVSVVELLMEYPELEVNKRTPANRSIKIMVQKISQYSQSLVEWNEKHKEFYTFDVSKALYETAFIIMKNQYIQQMPENIQYTKLKELMTLYIKNYKTESRISKRHKGAGNKNQRRKRKLRNKKEHHQYQKTISDIKEEIIKIVGDEKFSDIGSEIFQLQSAIAREELEYCFDAPKESILLNIFKRLNGAIEIPKSTDLEYWPRKEKQSIAELSDVIKERIKTFLKNDLSKKDGLFNHVLSLHSPLDIDINHQSLFNIPKQMRIPIVEMYKNIQQIWSSLSEEEREISMCDMKRSIIRDIGDITPAMLKDLKNKGITKFTINKGELEYIIDMRKNVFLHKIYPILQIFLTTYGMSYIPKEFKTLFTSLRSPQYQTRLSPSLDLEGYLYSVEEKWAQNEQEKLQRLFAPIQEKQDIIDRIYFPKTQKKPRNWKEKMLHTWNMYYRKSEPQNPFEKRMKAFEYYCDGLKTSSPTPEIQENTVPHKIIVGLGNPEKKYSFTKHNSGFLAVDSLQKIYNGTDWEYDEGLLGMRSYIQKDGELIMLYKPYTFLNDSGSGILQIKKLYKNISNTNITVYADDIHSPIGESHQYNTIPNNGHRGLQDIMAKIGHVQIHTIGTGKHENNILEQVLSNFSTEELRKIVCVKYVV